MRAGISDLPQTVDSYNPLRGFKTIENQLKQMSFRKLGPGMSDPSPTIVNYNASREVTVFK